MKYTKELWGENEINKKKLKKKRIFVFDLVTDLASSIMVQYPRRANSPRYRVQEETVSRQITQSGITGCIPLSLHLTLY